MRCQPMEFLAGHSRDQAPRARNAMKLQKSAVMGSRATRAISMTSRIESLTLPQISLLQPDFGSAGAPTWCAAAIRRIATAPLTPGTAKSMNRNVSQKPWPPDDVVMANPDVIHARPIHAATTENRNHNQRQSPAAAVIIIRSVIRVEYRSISSMKFPLHSDLPSKVMTPR